MSVHLSRPSRLDVLVRELPFAIDDFDAAGDAFVRWRQTQSDEDRHTVQLWAYCYTLWYFYPKFAQERTSGVSDLDAALDRSYDRILRSLDTIRDAERFPHFVSVVCKNVLMSHRTRRRETVEVDEEMLPTPEKGAQAYDRILVRRVLDRAIDAMPDAIREIGRMRLLEGRSYQDITEETGRPIASVRTYVSKVKARLRDNPEVRALYEGLPEANSDSDSENLVRSASRVRSSVSGSLSSEPPLSP